MHPVVLSWVVFAIFFIFAAFSHIKMMDHIMDLALPSTRRTTHVFLCAATFLAFVLSVVISAFALFRPELF